MRSLNLFPSDPALSPFGRRTRALHALVGMKSKPVTNGTKKTTASSGTKTKAQAGSSASASQPTPTPISTSATTSATTSMPSTTISRTANPSCNERLHLVLGRRSRQQEKELFSEIQAHARVKNVCIYTDNPLLTRKPVSSRQQRSVLTQATEICQAMTSLQLDFSSEFATPGTAGYTPGVVLDCEQLAQMLRNAPQLEHLSMKDVPLTGNVDTLRNALLYHPSLLTVELKWCNDTNTTNTDPHTQHFPPIMSTLITTLTQMQQLEELTLLLSHAHDLPLPQLAAPSAIQRLTLGLEQRHANQPSITREQRKEEQAALMQLLKDLKHNTNLKQLNLFSHHWKTETLDYIHDLVASHSSNLQLFHITDYNYGSDDPRQLLQLATALQENKKLSQFKLFSKKRLSGQVDKKTRRINSSAIDLAFFECLQRNTTLQHLTIVHAGIHLGDAIKIRPDTSSGKLSVTDREGISAAAIRARHMIPFYLMTNRSKARQQFIFHENSINSKAWREFIVQHKDNTPLVFYLLQENPSLLSLASQSKTNQYMWHYYF